MGCEACHHRMTHPPKHEGHVEIVYQDAYFDEGVGGYPDYLAEKDLLIAHGERYAALLAEKGIVPGKLLDVGCAAGFIMQGFINRGWQATGIEPNAKMAAYGRDEMKLNILNAAVECQELNGKFDLICLIQVIAHLIDPKAALEKLLPHLDAKGAILVETWNWRSFPALLWSKRWHEYNPPSVLHWFSSESLDILLKQCGYAPVVEGRPVKKISLRHAVSVLRHSWGWQTKHGKRSGNCFDRLELPYPAFDLMYKVYRRSSVVKGL